MKAIIYSKKETKAIICDKVRIDTFRNVIYLTVDMETISIKMKDIVDFEIKE